MSKSRKANLLLARNNSHNVTHLDNRSFVPIDTKTIGNLNHWIMLCLGEITLPSLTLDIKRENTKWCHL